MLSLPRISDINDSVCFDLEKSVVDCCQISAIVVVATIGFDSYERDGVLLDEDAFSFASLGRCLVELFGFDLIFLFDLFLDLLLVFLLVLLLDSFFSGG